MPKFIFSLILTALPAIFSQTAYAHALYAVAQYDGNIISGKAYYSDMAPAAETYVEAYLNGGNEPVIYGKTDNNGRFALPFSSEGNVKVVVEGEEGHKVTLVAERIQTAAITSNEFALLREDIAELKNGIDRRDILGGIGYIIGIVGIFAWFKARK